jgi:hypothetical protein
MLTLAQAAKETGLTKPAIFKAIKNGKISASKDARGQWMIDPAELFRVYAPASQKETGEPHTANVGILLANSRHRYACVGVGRDQAEIPDDSNPFANSLRTIPESPSKVSLEDQNCGIKQELVKQERHGCMRAPFNGSQLVGGEGGEGRPVSDRQLAQGMEGRWRLVGGGHVSRHGGQDRQGQREDDRTSKELAHD